MAEDLRNILQLFLWIGSTALLGWLIHRHNRAKRLEGENAYLRTLEKVHEKERDLRDLDLNELTKRLNSPRKRGDGSPKG